MTLSAVLFDMDGLLVDTEPIWQRAEDRAVAELGGTEWTPEDQRAVLGASLPLAGEYMRRRTGTSRSGDEVAQLIIGGFLDDVRAGSPIVVQPGAVELVNEVAGAGIPFALVSASVRAIVDLVTAHLASVGAAPFPVTVAGDEVDRGKPDPTPYQRAAELLGAPIGRAVVLEDSINGVQAGWSAGATVVAIDGMVRHEPRPRVVVRESLVGLTVAELTALAAG